MKTYYCVVTDYDACLIEIYRIVVETLELQDDIEFMAGQSVGYAENEDKTEQERVERVWLDTFADRQPFGTSDSPNPISTDAGTFVFFEHAIKKETP